MAARDAMLTINPSPRAFNLRQDRPGEGIGAGQVDLEQLAPLVRRGLFNGPLGDIDAGIIDQYIDWSECFACLVDGGENLIVVADISRADQRLPAPESRNDRGDGL